MAKGDVSGRNAGGRPRTDAGLVAEGVRLVAEEGLTPDEAGQKLTAEGRPISGRTIRRALPPGGPSALPSPPVGEKRQGAEATRLFSGSPADRLRQYAAHDPEALELLADLLGGEEIAPEEIPTLERVRKLIARVEVKLRNAPANRFAPLAAILDRLYARERLLLGPPPPAPDAVLEALQKLDAGAIAKIEEHLDHPITAKEIPVQ